MALVNIKIEGKSYQVEDSLTVLEACRKCGYNIPSLCSFMDGRCSLASCRVCLVEVKGARGLVASCAYPVNEGMEVFTDTPKVQKARKATLELILSNHDRKCLSCVRSGNCELQKLCKDYGVDVEDKYDGEKGEFEIDLSAAHMFRNNNKCILCRRCVAACKSLQGISVIGANERGFATHIGCAFDDDLNKSACVSCGQCINVCPTGALGEKDDTDKVWAALNDPEKTVVVQTAPATRVALGEEFGYAIGTNVEGKMATALRRLGFDKVFDTNFSADLTIMEEANEFISRVQNGGKLPLITSCSPGWVKFCEYYYPEFIDNLSSCKSPQQMFGAITKTYYAEKMGLDPKDIVVVSIMPCSAKKFEIGREDQSASGYADVDIAITTRELARMIKRAGILFNNLEEGNYDDPLGRASGAGVIFGATGGVMEAALRTAVETLTGEELKSLDFTEVRGTKGIKEATYNVNGMDVKVAVCSGLANARKLLDDIKSGKADYHFVEVMACPGGCVNGGGQPIQPASVRNFVDIKALRAKGLYDSDKANSIRKSHENPEIKIIYKEYLEKPGSHKAHKILHTSYVPRDKYEV